MTRAPSLVKAADADPGDPSIALAKNEVGSIDSIRDRSIQNRDRMHLLSLSSTSWLGFHQLLLAGRRELTSCLKLTPSQEYQHGNHQLGIGNGSKTS